MKDWTGNGNSIWKTLGASNKMDIKTRIIRVTALIYLTFRFK